MYLYLLEVFRYLCNLMQNSLTIRVILWHVTYFPLSHILDARDTSCFSAATDKALAVPKNFVNTSMNSRLIFGKPDLHICFRRSRDAFISPWVGFGVG